MRILHTSDWHLGLSTGPASRMEEHLLFFRWLRQTIVEREIDVLVVAGDIFDSMQPSGETMRCYYRFLGSLVETGVREVVIVGGNHDSPIALDAPRELLESLDIHVVGGLPSQEEGLDKLIIPLRARGSDDIAAVCVAVPYVHEYRLGVRTTERDPSVVREAFRERFAELYQSAADRAEERFPGVPLIATGHLTLGKASREDYPQEIHQVGFIDGLPDSILDPRLRYVALGHIHRCYPIDEARRAWYSGSPIPVSWPERKDRRVLMVELKPEGETQVEKLEVPISRELKRIKGKTDDVLAELAELAQHARRVSDAPLPPFLYIAVELENGPEPGLRERIYECLASFDEEVRPKVVELREWESRSEDQGEEALAPSLEELTEVEVFSRLCAARELNESSELMTVFGSLGGADPELFEEMLRKASGEETAG